MKRDERSGARTHRPLPSGPMLTLPVWVLGRVPTQSSVCPVIPPLAGSLATLSKVGKERQKGKHGADPGQERNTAQRSSSPSEKDPHSRNQTRPAHLHIFIMPSYPDLCRARGSWVFGALDHDS